jgi:hypothetical protein
VSCAFFCMWNLERKKWHENKRETSRNIEEEMEWGKRGIKKGDRGGEYNQSMLYACMKMSQWNPLLVQLIYTDENAAGFVIYRQKLIRKLGNGKPRTKTVLKRMNKVGKVIQSAIKTYYSHSVVVLGKRQTLRSIKHDVNIHK